MPKPMTRQHAIEDNISGLVARLQAAMVGGCSSPYAFLSGVLQTYLTQALGRLSPADAHDLMGDIEAFVELKERMKELSTPRETATP